MKVIFYYRRLRLLTITMINSYSCLHHHDIFTKTGIKMTTAIANIFPKKGVLDGRALLYLGRPHLKGLYD